MITSTCLHAGDVAAAKVDSILASAWSAKNIAPAELCSNEQFLRRASLDLIGRIPTVDERTAFLAAPDRAALVEKLLQSPEFPEFWAELWTTQLYGYSLYGDDGSRATLRNWLAQQLSANRPWDEIVEELLTSTGESAFDGPVNFLLRYPDEPVVKVSRSFLGVRLDCARCHDHPFDRWTQDDFKRMNRFFDSVERQDVSAGNTRLVDVVREASDEDRPRFLTGATPATSQWRREFSLFMTRSRPFARNFANRLWYHFLGRGIVHPVDDVNAGNPAAVPELLEALADEARAGGFDVRAMIRLIVNSRAYQLASVATKDDAGRQAVFAVRPVKPLSPEQWYQSLCVATNRSMRADERDDVVQQYFGDDLNGDYTATWEYRESVQGLMSRMVEPVKAPTRSVDDLFVRHLSRLPTSDERSLCEKHSADEITFALLHSTEFAFNH
jgi:hypothetical protein